MEGARNVRILIAGAGALGSLYGAFLRRAGHRVTLLGRAEHLEAIHARGLEVDGVFGDATVAGFQLATRPADAGGPFDLILLAVKSYAVESTVRPLMRALAANGRLLALQNGLGHMEALTALVGAERLLAAPVLIGATVPAPGRVRVTVYAKPVKIGSPSPLGLEGARGWAETLCAAGIPSEPTDRLLAFLWEKMLYNLPLNALGAILRVPYGALVGAGGEPSHHGRGDRRSVRHRPRGRRGSAVGRRRRLSRSFLRHAAAADRRASLVDVARSRERAPYRNRRAQRLRRGTRVRARPADSGEPGAHGATWCSRGSSTRSKAARPGAIDRPAIFILLCGTATCRKESR